MTDALHNVSPTHLCAEAEAIVAALLDSRSRALRELLSRCESPIEQQLLAALCDRLGGHVSGNRRRLVAPLPKHPGRSTIVA